ncbi:hypothetical protein [Afifella marina]|uniref:TonB family C-terminal domain-containing protein n=1 Tax=Afifella marina DSM 2698 TaxID=1120955 RepID=A0A1G5MGF9_AFIMA|nr:hypothetical protein [Afifella marina]MBK1625260.1 hypothetical protein [Afifella marina DSM 2698]MBK1628977.1 hypothetical protein [Afifella marina]MBK5918356.1 hypothetical protein [Afifella marina]RAI22870.1 hypothetical protein CH311_04260 [Afifella marina DSM 2698]SCZ23598.1 hypothetical protein SAMN03080610_00566 [Afifella marina DSM 2698]
MRRVVFALAAFVASAGCLPAAAQSGAGEQAERAAAGARAERSADAALVEAVRAVGMRIRACWNPPLASSGARAVVSFEVGEEGRLVGEPHVEEADAGAASGAASGGAGVSGADQAFALSAVRAVRNCAPYPEIPPGETVRAPFVFVAEGGGGDDADAGADANTASDANTATDANTGTDATPGADSAGLSAARRMEVGGRSFGYRVPPGFCRVEAAISPYDAVLLERLEPPKGRGATLVALEADCDELEAARAGADVKPRRLISIVAMIDGAGTIVVDDKTPREEFLKTMRARFSDMAPLGENDDAEWEGSRRLGHTDEAVVVVHKNPGGDGRSAINLANAYTLVRGVPFIVNMLAADRSESVAAAADMANAVVHTMVVMSEPERREETGEGDAPAIER